MKRASGWGMAVVLALAACGCASSDTSSSSLGNDSATGAAAPGTSGGGTPGVSSGSGGASDGTGTGTGGVSPVPPPALGGGATSSGGGPTGIVADGDAGNADAAVPTGVLTAGVWDDGLNYDFFSSYLGAHQGIDGDPGFSTADYDASHAEFQQRSSRSLVDVALVLDTTGSMSDELAYLTAEFANITTAVNAAFPGAAQRWALVVYRDTPDTDPGDAYVVQSFDFTSDMQAFAGTVGMQTAANGGDTPESPEIGLEQLGQLSWRTDPSVAKLAFWVADAPQHDYRAAEMKQAISDVHAAGIHVYPVSASGTDDLLELTMRTTAEITGGRYLFLTDDSGIGDPHKIPEIPCYYVTHLAKALVRVISMELSGTYIGPDSADVLRVSGEASPDGTCNVPGSDGGTVQIF